MPHRSTLRCPQCPDGGRVFRLTGAPESEPYAYRCLACGLKFLLTNPSSLLPEMNEKPLRQERVRTRQPQAI